MKQINNNKGGILSFVLVVFAVATTFGVALGSLGLVQNTMANREVKTEQAYLSARSMSEFLVTNGTEIIDELAKNGVGSKKELIGTTNASYDDFGQVDVEITGAYQDPITNTNKINVMVSAQKDGVTSTIKSVWRQQPTSTGAGLSFSGNFIITDCVPTVDMNKKPPYVTTATWCTNQTQAPQPEAAKLVEGSSNKFVLDTHTIVDEQGATFYSTKDTLEQQIQKLNNAYIYHNVATEDKYSSYPACVSAGAYHSANNPFLLTGDHYVYPSNQVNTTNCIIDTKKNHENPIVKINTPSLAIFEARTGSTINVVIALDKGSDYLNTWQDSLTFVVRGGGTVNFIIDYKASADKISSISLPQITTDKIASTKANVFFGARKTQTNPIVDTLVVNYGNVHNEHNHILGYRDGSVSASIYMPYTDLVVNGMYKNGAQFLIANPLFDGEIVTKSIQIKKAVNVSGLGEVSTGGYYTSHAWQIVNSSGSGAGTDPTYYHEVYVAN